MAANAPISDSQSLLECAAFCGGKVGGVGEMAADTMPYD